MKETMAERLKRLRLQHNLTLYDVGKILGIQSSAVSKYESGRTNNMKRSSIQKLADYYGVSPTYLLCIDDNEQLSPTKQELLNLLQTLTEEEATVIRSVIAGLRANKK